MNHHACCIVWCTGVGVKMPNVLGRGERVAAEYSMGYRSSSNFSVAATKPFPHKPLVPVLTATVYQQNHEYPWSGYRLLDRGALLDLAFKTSPAVRISIPIATNTLSQYHINKSISLSVSITLCQTHTHSTLLSFSPTVNLTFNYRLTFSHSLKLRSFTL